MDNALSPSPSRLPPFSILEFGDLVSAALDSPDPAFSFSSPSLFTATLARKKSAQTLNLTLTRAPSRVRLILTKLKTLMKRPRLRFRAHPKPRLPPPSALETRFGSADLELDFAPYLPLAVQYERLSPYAIRTSSLITHPESSSSHAPPSPTASSFESSSFECSSSTDTHFHSPTTPAFTLHRPWSVLPIDAEAPDDDPFAKGDVRIVHRSCEVLPSPPARPVRRMGRRRRLDLARRAPNPASRKQEDEEEEDDWTLALDLPGTPASSCLSPWASASPSAPSIPRPAHAPALSAPRLSRSRSLAHAPPQPRRARAGSPFPLTLRCNCTTALIPAPVSPACDSAYYSVCDSPYDASSSSAFFSARESLAG
ncbi:hypothetical protein DFH09DRAFT_1326424 [Mycena vulgaris]|nr:hypothetical protein DFH09DRAFT_1326424 [Mycena vulgaris]